MAGRPRSEDLMARVGSHRLDAPAGFATLAPDELDLGAEEFDHVAEEAFEDVTARLLEVYGGWSDRGLGEDDWVAHQLLHLKWGFLDRHLGRWRVRDLREILLELFPRKVIVDERDLPEVVPAVGRFLRFLDDAGLLDPHSDRMPRLREELERLRDRFRDEMRDPANFGIAKSLFGGMVDEGVDPGDPAAVEAWMDEFNARPDDERHRLLPGPVGVQGLTLPDEATLAAAALATPAMRQVAAFLDWVGDGRPLTQKGNLKLADGKALVELLETGDRFDEVIGDRTFRTASTTDLPGVDLVFRLALKSRLARRHKGWVRRTARGGRLPDDPLAAWRDVVEAMLDLGLISAGREDRYGLRWWAAHLEEGVVEVLVTAVGAGWPLPVEVLVDAAYAGFEEVYDLESLPEAPRKALPESLAWGVGALVDRLVWLGAATREGVAVEADRWGFERRVGGQLEVTDLGRWFVRPLLVARGYQVTVVGELAGAPADVLLATVADRPQESMRAEVRSWAAAREAAADELAAVARQVTKPDVRAVAFEALDVIGEEAVPAVRSLVDHPDLRPWAIGWLVARGEAEPDAFAAVDAAAAFVQASAVALVSGGPEAVADQLPCDAPVEQQPAMVEDLWRVDDPYTGPVLEALGTVPDRRIAKAARKALFKHRSARPPGAR